MSSAPRSWVLPERLVVPPQLLPDIAALMSPGRAEVAGTARFEDNVGLQVWLADLDRLHGVAPSARPEPLPERWLGTGEAAALLGLTERGMRYLRDGITVRKVQGNLQWLESDVLAELDARCWAADELRKAPASAAAR